MEVFLALSMLAAVVVGVVAISRFLDPNLRATQEALPRTEINEPRKETEAVHVGPIGTAGRYIGRYVALIFAITLARVVSKESFDGSPLASIALAGMFAGAVAGAGLLQDPTRRRAAVEWFASSRLDGPHRIFTVAAGLWAVIAPWFAETEHCRTGTVLAWAARWTGSCYDTSATVLTVIVVSALPPLLAYLALFFIAPPVLRWIRTGYDQGENP